jgi:hypothetical protein
LIVSNGVGKVFLHFPDLKKRGFYLNEGKDVSSTVHSPILVTGITISLVKPGNR